MADHTWSPEFLRRIRAGVDVPRITEADRDLLAGLDDGQQLRVDAATEAEWKAFKAATDALGEATERGEQTPEQYAALIRADRLLSLAMARAAREMMEAGDGH